MKNHVASLIVVLSSLFTVHSVAQGTAFSYQGVFSQNGTPYTGSAEMQFTIWDAASGGAAAATNSPASVVVSATNGLFTVSLDFGAGAFPGADRWLQIDVRTAIGPFTPLTPRQKTTATPYAIMAGNLSGALPSANLGGTYSNAVVFNNAANSFNGSGAGLTSLNASQLTTGSVPAAALTSAWKINGNAGTTAGANFIGTTDNQPFEIKVNGLRTARLEFAGDSDDPDTTADGAPNVILGAPVNFVAAGVVGSTIAGGGATNFGTLAYTNSILANFGSIGGGLNNGIGADSPRSTIAGGSGNGIGTNSSSGFIGGGGGNRIAPNSGISTIGGGQLNDVGSNSGASFVGGGNENNIAADSGGSVIVGGLVNDIGTNSIYSAIGGGFSHQIGANSESGTIAGGDNNTIANNSPDAAIAGGTRNDIGTNSSAGSIGGGNENNIAAGSGFSVIAGGLLNDIGTNSSRSTIGGGSNNKVAANSFGATIPGGQNNAATNYAFAAGRRAKANHTGAFVWADSTDADFVSTTNNQFRVRAGGGMDVVGGNSVEAFKYSGSRSGGFATPVAYGENNNTSGSSAPTLRLVGKGGNSADGVLSVSSLGTGNLATFGNSSAFVASLTTNGTWSALAFNPTSDRAAKENFTAVSPLEMLEKVAALPLARWNYKDAPGLEHIGPVAQDFHAAFGLNGDDDKHIATVDADGVALAAIQGLNQKLEEKDAEIQALRKQFTELKKSNDEREARLARLEKAVEGWNERPPTAVISRAGD